MSWIIVKRENDLWNIWSTNTDEYVLEGDMILEDVEQFFLEEEQKRIALQVKLKFERIRNGNKLHFKTEDEM